MRQPPHHPVSSTLHPSPHFTPAHLPLHQASLVSAQPSPLTQGLKSESRSVMFDSLWPHGLYSPWTSLGQNTGYSEGKEYFPFSRRSSQLRNRTPVSCTAGGFFTSWATREGLNPLYYNHLLNVCLFHPPPRLRTNHGRDCICPTPT